MMLALGEDLESTFLAAQARRRNQDSIRCHGGETREGLEKTRALARGT